MPTRLRRLDHKVSMTTSVTLQSKAALIAISIASFLLYASGTLALHQNRLPGWLIETEGAFPVAVSHLVYGAPLGAVDWNVFQAFERTVAWTPQQVEVNFKRPDGDTVQDVLAAGARGSIPRGHVSIEGTFDGEGVGLNLLATVAMWLFGIKISSIVVFYLIFVGLSVCAFVLRFRDQRLFVLPLYFLVVTTMLITPLSTSALGVSHTPIGGNRYFVLAAFLPTLHIFFDLVETHWRESTSRRIVDMLALFVQGIFLFATLLVRAAASYVLIVLVAVLVYRLFRARHEANQLLLLARTGSIVAAALAFWTVVVVVSFPAYVHDGRALDNFWHRAVRSFDMHPEWPFGNLREVFDCKNFNPGGLSAVHGDGTAQCIYFAYRSNRNRPVSGSDVYSGEYERVLRRAYFYVVTHYPRQVLQLYAEIKSERIKSTLVSSLSYLTELNGAPVSESLFIIVIAQAIIFSFAIVTMRRELLHKRMLIIPVLFLLSIAPRYLAWSSMETDADMIFLFYSTLFMGILFVAKSSIDIFKIAVIQRAPRASN